MFGMLLVTWHVVCADLVYSQPLVQMMAFNFLFENLGLISELCYANTGQDVEVEATSSANGPRAGWALPAMRRQNRCFGVAVTMVLIVATVYIVASTYSEPDEYNIAGEYDSKFGAVSDQANNAKVSRSARKVQEKSFTWGWIGQSV
jgi:hypothetical protein